jgi:FkbM family methyltransferase
MLETSLTKVPRLYAHLIARRPHPNLEKICFLSLIRRGDVIADVGANVGYYSLLFSRLVGMRGSVHSFEPAPPTFDQLEATIRREHRYNVLLNRCALADRESSTTLYLPGDDHGQASLARHSAGSWARQAPVHTYPCQVTTLDAYVASRGIAALSLLKCDVEGAELPVLLGARETIRRFTPLLFLEVSRHWSADFDYQPTDLVRLLETLGYSRFLLITDGLSPVLEVRHELDLSLLPESANLLCAHERHAPRLARLRPWLPRSAPAPR